MSDLRPDCLFRPAAAHLRRKQASWRDVREEFQKPSKIGIPIQAFQRGHGEIMHKAAFHDVFLACCLLRLCVWDGVDGRSLLGGGGDGSHVRASELERDRMSSAMISTPSRKQMSSVLAEHYQAPHMTRQFYLVGAC